MSYMSSVIYGVHVIRWIKAELMDVQAVLLEIRAAALELGRPIVGLAIIPNDAEAPSEETSRRMGAAMPALLENMESMHFLMEGEGFKHAVRRSIVAGIILLGGKRGRVMVHATVDEAMACMAPRLTVGPREFLQRLQQLDFVRNDRVRARSF